MKALTFAERLSRAEAALYQARAVALPAGGAARGVAVRHKRSVLRNGRAWIARLAGSRPPKDAQGWEIQRARWLNGQLAAEWPAVLESRRGK